MKTNAQQLHEEAGVFRLWATLASMGFSIVESAKITAKSVGGIFKTPLLAVAVRLEGGTKLGEAFDGEKVFSGYVPYIAGKESFNEEVTDMFRLKVASYILERNSRVMRIGSTPEEINEVMFYILLGALCQLGCPILRTLKIAGDEYELGDDSNPLLDEVEKGETITGGMDKLPKKFTVWDRNYIDVGEQSGALPEVCETLAEMKEYALLMSGLQSSGRGLSIIFNKVQMMEYELFAILVDAGMPILRALTMVAKAAGASDDASFAKMAKAIEEGSLLSEAMEAASCPSFIVEMVKLGEGNGDCEIKLRHISGYIKWDVLGIEPAPIQKPVEA